MAQDARKPDHRTPAPVMQDRAPAYCTPGRPANRPGPPNPSVLEQMYAYYDG
jgi:hypothetical protein